MTTEDLQAPPLPEDEQKMIKSTRIRVGRNLADFALGPGITNEQRKEIMNKVVEALNTLEGDLAGKFYPIAGMKEADRAQLVADHFLFK
jgi:protein-arginine kinase